MNPHENSELGRGALGVWDLAIPGEHFRSISDLLKLDNQASNIKHQTSSIKHQTSSIKHQTSTYELSRQNNIYRGRPPGRVSA